MGFGDFLGSIAGQLMAEAEEATKYKKSYEHMNNTDLKREYNAIRSKSGTEYRLRKVAIKMVLKDRGYEI